MGANDVRRRLLIVEDNADLLLSYQALLAHPSVDIHVATNGVQGVSMARAVLPHAIVLDVWLPGMDGFEIFRILRKEPELCSSRVLFVSAHSALGAMALAKDVGAYAWLKKPFPEDTFRRKVFEALELTELTPEAAARQIRRPTPPRGLPAVTRPAASARVEAVWKEPSPPPAREAPVFAIEGTDADTASVAAPPSKESRRPLILLVARLKYSDPLKRRLEAAGARVVVIADLASLNIALKVPGAGSAFAAALVVEPIAGMNMTAFVEYLISRGFSAPVVHLTSEAPQHPRLLTLPRVFTTAEIRALLTRVSRPKEPAEPSGMPDATTMGSPRPYLGF